MIRDKRRWLIFSPHASSSSWTQEQHRYRNICSFIRVLASILFSDMSICCIAKQLTNKSSDLPWQIEIFTQHFNLPSPFLFLFIFFLLFQISPIDKFTFTQSVCLLIVCFGSKIVSERERERKIIQQSNGAAETLCYFIITFYIFFFGRENTRLFIFLKFYTQLF